MSGYLSVARHPIILSLLDYWESKRRGRPFPGRRDIDPGDFVYALGNILLVDVLAGPRYRYRLFGTNAAFRHGFDLTGCVLQDMPQTEYRDFAIAQYDAVRKARKPLFPVGSRTLGNRLWHYEAALLPLAADGANIDMILVYLGFIEPPA